MDLRIKTALPIANPNGGYNSFPISDFCNFDENSCTQTATGYQYIFLDEFKKACLFDREFVIQAFSNVELFALIPYRIGRITPVTIPEDYEYSIIGAPKFVQIQGNYEKNECVFPYYQYKSDRILNFTCSTFDNCPEDFNPVIPTRIFLAYKSSDLAESILHDSLWEFSQQNLKIAIVLLYSSIELGVMTLAEKTENSYKDERISSKIHLIQKEIKDEDIKKWLRKIKKPIKKNIIDLRGQVAHLGESINEKDLLKSYATALEFFWHYDKLKEYLEIA